MVHFTVEQLTNINCTSWSKHDIGHYHFIYLYTLLQLTANAFNDISVSLINIIIVNFCHHVICNFLISYRKIYFQHLRAYRFELLVQL